MHPKIKLIAMGVEDVGSVETTKINKCDYCDEYAKIKVKDSTGLNLYLCNYCAKDLKSAKMRINSELF